MRVSCAPCLSLRCDAGAERFYHFLFRFSAYFGWTQVPVDCFFVCVRCYAFYSKAPNHRFHPSTDCPHDGPLRGGTMLRALRVGVGFEIRLLFLACRRDLRSARRLSHRHAVQPRVQPQAGIPFDGGIGPSLSFCTSFCTAVFP